MSILTDPTALEIETRTTRAIALKSAVDAAYFAGLPMPSRLSYELAGTDSEAAAELLAIRAHLTGRFLYRDFSYKTCFGIEIDTGGASLFYTKIRDAAGVQP